MEETVLDTGALIAFLHRNDQYHDWAREQTLRHTYYRFRTCNS